MSGWLPGAGWPPWAALAAAGVRVVDDERSLSPPCALVTIDRAEMVGACAVDYTVSVRLIAPGDAGADSQKWLWGEAVVPLLPFAGALESQEWQGYPTVVAVIVEGGQQWQSTPSPT